jgi:hypothetical protein
MHEAAQHVAPSDAGALCKTGDRIEPRLWRLQLEAPMRPPGVVMRDVGPKDALQVAAAEHEHPVQALGPNRADPPLGEGVRCGARTGVWMILTPSERNTSSNAPVNLESRSRIRNRTPRSRSPTAKLGACWVIHAESGFAVTPRTSTRRDATSIAKST